MSADGTPPYVEEGRDYQRSYYAKHREKKIEYARSRLQRNNELRRIRVAEERAKNPPKKRERKPVDTKAIAAFNRVYHYEKRAAKLLSQKIKSLQIVSGKNTPECCKCGIRDIRALSINHINGGGRAELSSMFMKGAHAWRRAIVSGERSVDDLDVRCFNCNIIYEYERGRSRLPRNWEAIVEELTRGD